MFKRFWGLSLTIATILIAQPLFLTQPLFVTQPLSAQTVGANEASQQIYQKISFLPLENQYVSRITGKQDTKSTLVNRLIRYHLYTKGRPANYRLDWKLTLADYLGVNEIMDPATYPGAGTLKSNPMDADRVAIQKLDRNQRNALVQALVDTLMATKVRPGQAGTAPSDLPLPTAPRTGGASLLK
ncbi:hypothetical protein [Alkalinema sp. FACHB-956]|uniref:hypothetical protein n=1 Tax=Alkalinema sp. FACHB-956 TaxID=2692768 RepID=UPI001684E3EC|nr:hypothetical protein [Alkalinema sp. FACHB-956]MBD2328573.1 hypothetical protein [Alkalinema sp. FACHB-956]